MMFPCGVVNIKREVARVNGNISSHKTFALDFGFENGVF